MADDIKETSMDTWTKRITVFGAIGVTAAIFGMFFFGLVISAYASDLTPFNNLLETVKALIMVAAGYWIGTSRSSSKKDDIIAHSTEMLATSVPGSIVKKECD